MERMKTSGEVAKAENAVRIMMKKKECTQGKSKQGKEWKM